MGYCLFSPSFFFSFLCTVINACNLRIGTYTKKSSHASPTASLTADCSESCYFAAEMNSSGLLPLLLACDEKSFDYLFNNG